MGTVFEAQCTLEPIYTGGRCEVATLPDGPALFMRAGASFGLYDPATGAVKRRLVLVPAAPSRMCANLQ